MILTRVGALIKTPAGPVCCSGHSGRDRLLTYSLVRRYLEWDATRTDGGVTIHVRAVNDGVTEPWIPTVDELDGITFYTLDPGRTRVVVAGEELSDVSVTPLTGPTGAA